MLLQNNHQNNTISILWSQHWCCIIFGNYFETALLFKLTKPAVMIITSFNNLIWVIRMLDWRIISFLNRPMALSTCTRTFDIFRDIWTAFPDICALPFVKCGIFNVAPHEANSSATINPRLASMQFPCCKCYKNLDLSVIYLSDTRLRHPWHKKLTAPAGVIPIR